jgi:hypothetical protein
MRAGGYIAIAAALLLLLFLLLAVRRRQRRHAYMGHKQLGDEDFDEDETYLKDETSNDDSPRHLSHVVNETDSSMGSGWRNSPQKLGSPYDRDPRSHTQDVHVCSSATCANGAVSRDCNLSPPVCPAIPPTCRMNRRDVTCRKTLSLCKMLLYEDAYEGLFIQLFTVVECMLLNDLYTL